MGARTCRWPSSTGSAVTLVGFQSRFASLLSVSGSFTSDLAALLGVSCDGEFRRKYADELLTFYRDTLFEQFAKIRVDPPALELATLKGSFDVSLRCAALQMAMTVVTNPKHDEPLAGAEEGPLTKRFRMLVEDLFA